MFWLTLHVERESKCGAYYNLHRIKLKKALGLQQITKTLTMYDCMDRCMGCRVDKGALGANAQIKNDLLASCVEFPEKHSEFRTHSRKTWLWVKKPVHFLLHGRERNFGWNSLNSALNLAFCKQAWAGYGSCKLNKPKWSAQTTQMGGKLIPIPNWVVNMLHPFRHLNEQNKDAYKSSWFSWTRQQWMQALETSSIRNKQRTKLITIKETKLECIREI